jgi:hypothetical protein
LSALRRGGRCTELLLWEDFISKEKLVDCEPKIFGVDAKCNGSLEKLGLQIYSELIFVQLFTLSW